MHKTGFIDLGITIAVALLVILITGFVYFQYFASEQPLSFLDKKLEPYLERASSNSNPEFFDGLQKTKLLWAGGEFNKSLVEAEKLLTRAKTNGEKAVAHYWTGLSYYKLNQIDKAKSEELLALELDPSFGAPYVTLAAISLGKNDCQTAFEYAEKAVAWDTNYAWSHNSLGLAYICLGNNTAGIVELEKAVELDPEAYVFRSNLQRFKELNK